VSSFGEERPSQSCIRGLLRAFLDLSLRVQVADCLSLFALLHTSLLAGQPMPPTMPIFERLVYHAQKKEMFARQFEERVAKAVDDDDDEEEDGSMSIEAQEDSRALLLLDEPLTWDLCHVSAVDRLGV
jgi:hypothetical protein